MENPTAANLIALYTAKVNSIVTHNDPVTDQELVDVFNGALEVAKTVDPTKGTPTVKHVL